MSKSLIEVLLEKVRLIEESGSDINRVAPVAQIDVNDSRSRRIRFSHWLVHNLSRTRAYPRLHSTRTRNGVSYPIQIQLNRTRGNEGGAERDRVRRILNAEKWIGGVVDFTKRWGGGWFGGEGNRERVGGGGHGLGFGLEFGGWERQKERERWCGLSVGVTLWIGSVGFCWRKKDERGRCGGRLVRRASGKGRCETGQ